MDAITPVLCLLVFHGLPGGADVHGIQAWLLYLLAVLALSWSIRDAIAFQRLKNLQKT